MTWPTHIKVDHDLLLEIARLEHASELYAIVDENRNYLSEWLPWPEATVSIADTISFLESADKQLLIGTGVHYVIKYHGSIAGVIGFYHIDLEKRLATLGFWLGEKYQGQGIMTRASKKITKTAIQRHGIIKIEIRCAVENIKSRRVPERLGYIFSGIKKDAEILRGVAVDHAVYITEAH